MWVLFDVIMGAVEMQLMWQTLSLCQKLPLK